MKNKFLILFTIISLGAFSQDILVETKIENAGSNNFWDQCYIENLDNGKQVIVLLSYNINALVLDSNFSLINKIEASRPYSNSGIILGYSEYKEGVSLFLCNDKRTLFSIKNISFSGENHNEIKLGKINNEAFLESFSINNKFYLLTVKKNTSITRCAFRINLL